MPLFRRRQRTAVVMIHGFGMKVSKEFDPLKRYLTAKGLPVITFDIYNPKDPEDSDPAKWISRCENKLREAFDEYREVVLIGFSMGGVIASYLASIFPVKMLILVAPAFYYMDAEKIRQTIVANLTRQKTPKPSSEQTRAFSTIVSTYRESIRDITCPILIIHGTADQIIDLKSSHRSYDKIAHDKKRLIYIEGAQHRMLYDGKLEKTVFTLIYQMIQGELI